MNMKTKLNAIWLLLSAICLTAHAQGTAFSYQGRLNDGGQPANGNYDLTFSLYYTNASGVPVAGPVTNSATVVSNGLFTTAIDFGSGVFNGTNCWLELGVRTNGSATAFGILTPRQPLTPVPYALFALTPSGTNGVNGFNGTNGLNGINGTNGINGLNGTNGIAGMNGTNGVNGTNGLDGATGAQGPIGLTGAQGGQGVQGIQGIAGINGTNGVNGTNGLNGATGPAGPLLPDLALVDTNQIFIGSNTFTGVLIATNATNVIYGAFTGNGGGLTNLNVSGSKITGVIPLAQLPASVVTNGANGVTFSGTFSGNGAGVTNLNLTAVNNLGVISFTTNASGVFTLASSPGVGSQPVSVVAADVNGDGKPDLINANLNSPGTLTVLTNNGSGGFGFNATLNVGSSPRFVAAADVNGDGWVDLISANSGANTLTVLTNNGSGGFVVASSPGVGNSPYSVAAADVNGDGKPDLISANYNFGGTGSLTVLTNNGSGGFGSNATLTVGSNPISVVAADVNGDGKLDLISANDGANTLTVLTNNGSGGFVVASSPGVGNGPVAVVAADVNGDGKVDLISANNAVSTLTVLTNNGSGGFVLASTVSVSCCVESVVPADVNGDGKPDLISANNLAGTLTVFTNNGSGGFALAATLTVGIQPASVVAADVNGDGTLDLISANRNSNRLTVLTNAATIIGTFTGNVNGTQIVASGNVGIGTTSPSDLLEVFGTTSGKGIVLNDGTFTHKMGQRGDTFDLSANTGGSGSTGDIRFNVGSPTATKMIVARSGNVGIGTTTPSASLEISSSGSGFEKITDTTSGNSLVLQAGSTHNMKVTGFNFGTATAIPLYLSIDGANTILNYNGGRVGIGTESPGYALDVVGDINASGNIRIGGTIKLTSDRNVKENFTAINPQQVLAKLAALPVTVWNYKRDSKDVQHLGPMAQDFQAAFGLDGADDKHISVIDENGVALAAIQGLNQKVEAKDAEIQDLKARLEKLEQLMNAQTGAGK
jgi:hypothetical protein